MAQRPRVPDRWNLKTKTGGRKGYVERDLLLPDQKNIFDFQGNQKGILKRDPLSPNTCKLEGKRLD
jgi:hypothetical protein